jgi:PAS domain S-box-containing protein
VARANLTEPAAPGVPAEWLSALLDEVDEGLSWFDADGQLCWCNPAAARSTGLAMGQGAAAVTVALGGPAAAWLRAALKAPGRVETTLRSPQGQRWRSRVWSLGPGRAWRLQALDAAAPAPVATAPATPGVGSDLTQLLWHSAFPASVQDAQFRLVDVNDAYCSLTGWPREDLVGRDPIELQPPEDRDGNLLARAEMAADLLAQGGPVPVLRRRLVDATGAERWYSQLSINLALPGQPPVWLSLLLDLSGEVAAREHARRVQDELAHWFELSGTGMLVYDDSGLIVRSNAAFEALVERVPEVLDDAQAELQALLAWQAADASPAAGDAARGRPEAALRPGAAVLERQVLLPLADGRRRRLLARLSCFSVDRGEHRVMAVVEDRSTEDERDLAQLEMGMLMDTASIGVATYDPARGWLAPRAGGRAGSGATSRASPGAAAEGDAGARPGASTGGALMGIGRDLVEPASLPEYERLQRALRQGERTEVRYAVRHPELGPRWLLTRVEPGALSGGRPTTSVVTLDVTDQERAQRRNEQLLRELTTILDGSTAGIAYLRGPLLVRCNRRFERMLGFEPGAAAGASLEEILGRQPGSGQLLAQATAALEEDRPFETELEMSKSQGPGRPAVWFSLSVRRAEPAAAGAEPEAVAVLTDISSLKSQQTELEQLLRERELMFSLSDVGIAYLRGARIERANQALALLTGYASPELTTLDAAELYASARDCVAFEARVTQALRSHGRFSGERQLRRRDGSLVWVQVAVRPVDGDSAEAGVICSFVDVDERYRARVTLAAQAERTRAILDSVLVGIVTVGAGGGIAWMNRSARRMFGGELADFVGEPISGVATPEADHPLRRIDWFERLGEGQSETFECRLQGRDGRTFWVVGNAVVTRGESANGAQLTFALLDIERRRQAEVRIAQAQSLMQRVIQTAPMAIALFDARSLQVLQLNHAATQFFQRPVDEVLGVAPEAACSPELAAALRGWLEAAAVGQEAQQHEWRDDSATAQGGLGSGEGVRVWDCRVVPLAEATLPEDGAPAAGQLLLVASDVTEQRAAERARLQAAITQREALVREVHHRIKNNLQGVAGLLRQNAARHPELADSLNEAVGQVQAIAQVYGLQVGAGGPLKVTSVLRAIAQSVSRTFGRRILVQQGRAEGPLDFDPPPPESRSALQPDLPYDAPEELPHELPEAESIPVALTVNELFTNAIKHGRGAQVHCRVWADDDTVVIAVYNRGQLPAGFDLGRIRGGVSGLGLVRALLPRRSAALDLRAADEVAASGPAVVAEVQLRPPSVRTPDETGTPVAVSAG